MTAFFGRALMAPAILPGMAAFFGRLAKPVARIWQAEPSGEQWIPGQEWQGL